MGFLDMLWDETLAGPTPDTGLGKLRKYNSLSAVRSPPPTSLNDVPISRAITILKTNSSFRSFSAESASGSPSGSKTSGSPRSPFTPRTPETPREDFRRLTRKREEAYESAETRTIYDWLVINGLDR